MTPDQLKRILNGIGISSYENIQIPELNNIIMSQNFFVVPKRDYFTFNFANGLIKVKQYNPDKDFYDYYFDMANIVGIEFLSPKSRY